MAFYVGQKVVCVDASNDIGKSWYPGEELVEGQIYTITAIGFSRRGEALHLAEVARSEEVIPKLVARGNRFFGYGVRRFRPIVERKTDISIFTDMLARKTEQVSA